MKIATHVFMFKARFAPLVKAGTKSNTIRPMRKRMPKVGNLADLRQWTGKPYNSSQRKLRLEIITGVALVTLDYSGVTIDGIALLQCDQDKFAQADGFNDWAEMLHWFNAEHSLPFNGFITKWNPSK